MPEPPRPKQRTAPVYGVPQRLPPDASVEQTVLALEEMAKAYASLAAKCTHEMTVTAATMEEFRAELVVLGSRVGRIEEYMGGGHRPPRLPPMRAEMQSSHAIAERVGRGVAEKYEEQVNNPSTPPPGPHDIRKLVEDGVQIEMVRLNAARLQKAEDERQAQKARAEEDARLLDLERQRAKRKLVVVMLSAILTTTAAVVVALVEHFAK
jgi:hypothetical protein